MASTGISAVGSAWKNWLDGRAWLWQHLGVMTACFDADGHSSGWQATPPTWGVWPQIPKI